MNAASMRPGGRAGAGSGSRSTGRASRYRSGAVGQAGASSLASPTARRLARPSWNDWRLVVGVLLVLLATVLGARAVAAADSRGTAFVASGNLKAGDQLTASSVHKVAVQLGDSGSGYLSGDAVPDGRYVLRDVRAGELVPASAVGDATRVGLQSVTVTVPSESARVLVAGSVVDVWVSDRDPSTTQTRYLDPQAMLRGATVASLPSDDARFGAAATQTAVTLSVPVADVAKVIAASDKQSRVTLVPVAGSLVRSAT